MCINQFRHLDRQAPGQDDEQQAARQGPRPGIPDFRLSVEVPIPTDGSEPDWLEIEGAKLTVVPIDGIGKREVFYGCEVETMSSKPVENAAMRTLTITALDRKVQ